jgi:hypothetical protein
MFFPIYGVYVLYDRAEIIYYGKSSAPTGELKDRLLSHVDGREGRCTQLATHFAYEGTIDADGRERELLVEFEAQNGHLPRCNEKIG